MKTCLHRRNVNIYLNRIIIKCCSQRDGDKSAGQGGGAGHYQRADEGGPQHHQDQQRQDPGREQKTEGGVGEAEETGEKIGTKQQWIFRNFKST